MPRKRRADEQETSAGIILFSGNPRRYLFLLQRSSIDFPKGKVESGETHKEAALRETKEETGISSVEIVPGFRERISFTFKREKKKIHKSVTFFLGETQKRKVRLGTKYHKGYLWLKAKTAISRLRFKKQKDLIRKAEEFLNGKSVKADKGKA